MYIKTVLVLFVIGTTFGGLLIGITSFFNNRSVYDNHQAFATHMETATSNEKSVVHQGIIASGSNPQIEPESNESRQSAVILPYRSDGSIYSGVLTFTASKPVEVTFSHRIPIDNTTLSHLDVQKYGKLFVHHLNAFQGNVSTPSRIIPDYSGGSTSPYFSASMPFVASSVVLRTNGEPFIVAYELSADIVKPKIINHLENALVTSSAAANSSKVK